MVLLCPCSICKLFCHCPHKDTVQASELISKGRVQAHFIDVWSNQQQLNERCDPVADKTEMICFITVNILMQMVSILEARTTQLSEAGVKLIPPRVPKTILTSFLEGITYFILQIPHKNSGQALRTLANTNTPPIEMNHGLTRFNCSF